jgi:UDP-N-acetylmuramyl pentapeptide phosphotransferase/UDP-N-acetylglucosamine-1-phosphate transferase
MIINILIIFFPFIFFLINYLFLKKKLLVYPQKRNVKLYNKPVPFSGGIYFLSVCIFLFILINIRHPNFLISINNKELFVFLIFSSFFFFIGFVDDLVGISGFRKVIIFFIFYYIIFSILFNISKDLIVNINNSSIYISHQNKILIFSLLATFFSISFILIDGINCYMMIIFLAFLGLISNIFINNEFFKVLFVFFVYMSIIFLIFNFINKSYLGNSGSYLLAFLIVFFFYLGKNLDFLNQKNTFFKELFLINFINIVDISRVFLYRLISRRSIFSKDFTHLHYLVFNKHSLFISLFVLFLIFLFPYILLKFLDSFVIAFWSSLLIYFILVRFVYKNSIKI